MENHCKAGEGCICKKGLTIDNTYGHPHFYSLIEKMAKLHATKNRDYGGGNPLGNFLNCEKLGVDPFMGIPVRMSDKWSRICSLTKSGEQHVKDESIEDTLLDLSIYCLLALVVKRHLKLDGGQVVDSAVVSDPENYGKVFEESKAQAEGQVAGVFVKPTKVNPCEGCEFSEGACNSCTFDGDCVALEMESTINQLNNDQYVMNLKSFTCLTCTMFAGDPDHEAHNCYHCIYNGKPRPGAIDYYVDSRIVAILASKGAATGKMTEYCSGNKGFCSCEKCEKERFHNGM